MLIIKHHSILFSKASNSKTSCYFSSITELSNPFNQLLVLTNILVNLKGFVSCDCHCLNQNWRSLITKISEHIQ